MCDKSVIDNTYRTKSVRTQYKESHFNNNEDEVPCQPQSYPLKVKFSLPKKKQKSVEVNTILSFKSFEEVVMTIPQDTLSEDEFMESEDIDNSDSDTTYTLEDESHNENEITEDVQQIPLDTKFLVF